MKLALRTAAKINLGLHIHRKRDDGYHELETLFQMVSLCDRIELETRPSGVIIECDQPGIPTDETNLAAKAANLLLARFPKVKSGVRIRLIKKIPSGAGLGGGSGNAAGVLLALNRLWELGLTRRELAEYGAELGSDVPFFVTAPCALGRGRGEILEPVEPCKKFYVLLVNPGFPISTSSVYKALKIKLTKRENHISILRKFFEKSDFSSLGESLYNDLEPIVIKEFPVIQAIKNQLISLGAQGALLSGSGSTVFGIFADSVQAQSARDRFQNDGWDLFLTENIRNFSEVFPEEILNYP